MNDMKLLFQIFELIGDIPMGDDPPAILRNSSARAVLLALCTSILQEDTHLLVGAAIEPYMRMHHNGRIDVESEEGDEFSPDDPECLACENYGDCLAIASVVNKLTDETGG